MRRTLHASMIGGCAALALGLAMQCPSHAADSISERIRQYYATPPGVRHHYDDYDSPYERYYHHEYHYSGRFPNRGPGIRIQPFGHDLFHNDFDSYQYPQRGDFGDGRSHFDWWR